MRSTKPRQSGTRVARKIVLVPKRLIALPHEDFHIGAAIYRPLFSAFGQIVALRQRYEFYGEKR